MFTQTLWNKPRNENIYRIKNKATNNFFCSVANWIRNTWKTVCEQNRTALTYMPVKPTYKIKLTKNYTYIFCFLLFFYFTLLFFLSLLAKLFIRIICCRINRVAQLVHGIKTEQNPSYGTVKAQRIYRFSMHIYVLQQLFFAHKMGWACWYYNKPDSWVFETFTARNREQWTNKENRTVFTPTKLDAIWLLLAYCVLMIWNIYLRLFGCLFFGYRFLRICFVSNFLFNWNALMTFNG